MDPGHDVAADATTVALAEVAWLLYEAEQHLARTAADDFAPGDGRSARAASLDLALLLIRSEVVDLLPDLRVGDSVTTTPETAPRTVSALLEAAMRLTMSVDPAAVPAVTPLFVELSAAARDARRLGW